MLWIMPLFPVCDACWRKRELRPHKGLRQIFIDKNILQKIANAAECTKNDVVWRLEPAWVP